MEVKNALGRRKAAVARVYLTEGKGKFTVNDREIENFFPTETLQYIAKQPLTLLGLVEKYDVKVNIFGGGVKGQAEAVRLGVSRALLEVNPEYRPALKKEGFLTRDPREVERKKPGQPKARKKFQFSKR
ncbi:MAG: 30S ribosomal protein S9 [Bacteroidetes bacterium GWF2_33_16]|nr:MAG: 30S ribosomal protein S9 [Bacteroidetes bacterium GWE2_32_14]OFY03701.1 MAG: 30S ribosomal protein S9 [Bacteroidetes bacterium GWF2_33_16]